MRRAITGTLLLLSLFLAVSFAVLVIAQTVQLVEFARSVHPVAGDVAFWSLLAFYATCLAVPAFLVLRLPRSLKVPADDSGPEFDRHLRELRKRLRKNAHLSPMPLDTREEIEAALEVLGERADVVIRKTAGEVFITTAVSQNGSLDAVFVLAAQSRMTWTLAHLYYQRPGPRELAYLYANVAATAFVTSEIEDFDLAAQLQPVISGAFGSVAGAVPGAQAVGTLATNAIFGGAANAFMTLRIGLIARDYCGALVRPDPRLEKRSATAGAALMLGGVVTDGARQVAAAFVTASARSVADAAKGAARGVGGMAKSAKTSVAGLFRQGDGGEEAAEP